MKRALQSKGSESAKRHLKTLSHKVSRFRLDCDHVVSRQLVQSVAPSTTLVIENLKDIRTETRHKDVLCTNGRSSACEICWCTKRKRAAAWSLPLTRAIRLSVVLVVAVFIVRIVALNLVSSVRIAVLNSTPTSTLVGLLL